MKALEKIINGKLIVNAGLYDLSGKDLQYLYNYAIYDCFKAIGVTYLYGFIRGQRAEKARHKKGSK